MTDTGAGYDVIVLGLGPGREDLAEALARAGRSVLAVGPHLVGGECPYYGCIPSKMMLRAAQCSPRAEKPDASELARRVFEREGIAVHCGATPVLARAGGDGVEVTLADGSVHTAATVLVAVGRRANVGIGLDSRGSRRGREFE